MKLTILDNNSSPNQVVTDYQTLINHDHVDLTFGPFTSLLTAAAASVAAHNGYAFIEGAGGAPSVFDAASNQADHNTFDVSVPVEDTIMPFVNYIAQMPLSQRERLTAAYPMADDPFAIPPVQLAEQKLHALHVQTKTLTAMHIPSRRCPRATRWRRPRWRLSTRTSWCSAPPTCRPSRSS